MRFVFMGTDKFAVPALKSIINSKAELVCVITQPDQPKGRGLKIISSPVKEAALEYNMPVYQPDKIREKGFIEKIKTEFMPDLIVVTAYGQILPKAILDLPAYGCINIHPSLLPKYRGAAPIQRAIMNGENETGVTLMFMDEGEDTGDIMLQESIKIDISDTAAVLSQKLSNFGACMLSRILKDLQDKKILPRQPQDHSKASYAPKLTKEDGLINWEKSAFEIHNLVRGTIPWPGAYTIFGNDPSKILKIWGSGLSEAPSKAKAGTITDILQDSGIVIATADMDLIITTVQPSNKPKMKARDFINGYRIKIGDMLGKGESD